MSTTVPRTIHHHDRNDDLVLSSSSSDSSVAESEWEENNHNGDTDDSVPSSAPPPVIFAGGVSSPGRFRIPTRKRLSDAATHNSRRRTAARMSGTTQVIRRTSLKGDLVGAGRKGSSSSSPKIVALMGPTSSSASSSSSNVESSLLMNDNNSLTPTPAAMPRRPSITRVSTPLVTASCRAEIQRRSRRSAKLRNQVAELEAALNHSKAKESALKHNLDDLRDRLMEKSNSLEERQKVIQTLEHEHRSMKKHFRELMESTLDSSGSSSQHETTSQHDDIEMNACGEDGEHHQQRGHHSSSLSSILITTTEGSAERRQQSTNEQPQSSTVQDVEGDTEMVTRHQQEQEPSSSSSSRHQYLEVPHNNNTPQGSQQQHRGLTSIRRDTTTTTTSRRTRSVPPPLERHLTARDQDLRNRLRETEELLETLRGTNGYAQTVLKRNSVLEKRCDELENLRDLQLREVYDELQRCRVEQIEASTAAERYRNEASDARQRVADLHAELQRLHEKMRRQQDSSLELAEAREALADTKEALGARVAEAQRAAGEWEAEKQHLLRNVDLHKRLLAAKGEGSQDDSSALRDTNSRLEELLATTREQATTKINGLENEMQELKNHVRTLTSKLDYDKRALENQTERNAELEDMTNHLRAQLEALRKEADGAYHDVARLSGKAAEVEELKNQLKVERERMNSQNNQIARHLESIKESNQRFADLVERNNVLDKLLQKQQKEKENLMAENMKTNSKLYSQADNYRKKWEATSVEVQTLKKQLSDSAEKLRLAVEQEKVDKDRELRQLRDEFAALRLAFHRNADQEMAKLRAQHSLEMTELRKLKDAKLETVVKQYETYLGELKVAHERHVKDFQGVKDKDAVRTKEEINQRVSETQALWKERLNEERSRHEKEIQTLTASYQDNLQSELKKKSEELDKLRRSLDAKRADMERIQLMAERRIQDEKLQREQLAARIGTEAQDAATAAAVEERERGRAALAAAQSEHAKAIKTIEEAHTQTSQTLNRKLGIMNEKLNGTIAENEKLMATINARDVALGNARTEVAKAAEMAEAERKKEAAAALKEQELLKTQIAEARRTIQQLREGVNNVEEIDRLNERIQTLLMNNTELENRLKNDRDLLKSQLNAKEERLQTLLTENAHTKAVLQRNSELEESSAKEKNDIEASLQQQRARAAALESEIARLKDALAQGEIEQRQMSSDLNEKQHSEERLLKRLEAMADRVTRQGELEEKVKELTAETIHLRRQLDSTQGTPDHESDANRRYRERLREMGQELTEANAKGRRLQEEIMNMKNSLEESSKLTLDLQHLKSRLESQNELVDLLKQRASKKDDLINDLKVQLNSLLENRRSDPSDSDHENEKKLEDLVKKCQDLSDLQQTFEQERRSLEHRMELDRQMLTQKIDQKDCQLELLMETNKRAELCFARNIELEELLLRSTNDLATLRREEQQRASSTSEENVINSTSSSSIMHSSTLETSVREDKLRQELDDLRSDLMQKDGEIRLLQTRTREMKSRHLQEIEELNSRLKFASLEESFKTSASGSGEDGLIQSLIDQVTQLQEQVKRLRKGQDAQVRALEAENEFLRTATYATPARQRRESMGEDGRPNVSFLETTIDTLEIERDALRVRVTELVEALKASSSIEISEVEELKQRNLDLQRTVDKLNEIVGDQKRTLDIANRHADEALRQNGTLQELTERLDLHLGDDHVLENILKRNIELESLLQELQQQNNEADARIRVSRRSTTATVTSTTSGAGTRIVHRHSASPLLAASTTASSHKTTDEDMLSASMPYTKHTSPATTPSTSVGENSRFSPPSPSLLGPQADSTFILSNSYNNVPNELKSDTEGRESRPPIPVVPRVSLYRTIRSSVDEVDEMEEEGRGRRKRPRTVRDSAVTSSRYMMRSRSKANSLPAGSDGVNHNQHNHNIIDITNSGGDSSSTSQ